MQNAVFHLDADRVAVVGVLVDEEGRTCYSVWVREHLETAAADWSYVPVIGQLPTPTADVPGVGPAGSDPTGPGLSWSVVRRRRGTRIRGLQRGSLAARAGRFRNKNGAPGRVADQFRNFF